ncbi:hypothetical protein Taro_049958 [Colocasia esculenta]|uniref:WRKY domain-containing protein n=1 Tax=Colocasia esculenta TaxID=4460 RepID=A0A843XCH3_COLES|nr:hypothetical protein [Colocasia esculenta]
MAEADAPKRNICGRPEEELMRELMDDGNAFFLLAQDADMPALSPHENTTNKLMITTVYSGPTIRDVEAALAMNCSGSSGEYYSGNHGIAFPEKGFNKMEGKFTMTVKCSSNGIADDGYKWRKYGQKVIKNSPHPRSYYRCTNPRCNAKKQVERSAGDPETLVVTYEGLHLHYAFSHFLLPRPCDASTAGAPTFSSVKRARVETRAAPQASKLEASAGLFTSAVSRSPAALALEGSCSLQESGEADAAASSCSPVVKRGEAFSTAQSSLEPPPEGGALAEGARGLLEDVVPGLFRKPCSSSSGADTVLSDQASLFSAPSSPPSSAPSSPFSWPLFDDLGILSLPSSPASSSSSAPFSWPHDPSFFDMVMLPGTV